MTLKTFATAACLLAVTATTSFAATFTVGGDDFDITTITGTFEDNQTLLESQVWWANDELASALAREVAFDLGTPKLGPLFAYDFIVKDSLFYARVWNGSLNPLGGLSRFGASIPSPVITFAVATPLSAVPIPAGGLLLLSGLSGVAALKRRKKRAA